MKEKWIADFSKPEKTCFDIKPEISFNAYLEKGSLFFGLKKKNCMAWLETVRRVYVDQIIEAHFRFNSPEGRCATGIMFRITEQGMYYLALVSSKGYFRLDVVNNNIPKPLIEWIEAPGLNENKANLGIIAKDDHFIFLLNGKWIAETNDVSIPGGHLGFALVSYDEDSVSQPETPLTVIKEGYACRSWLNFLSVDSRSDSVNTEYKKWTESMEICAESRRRLAESFAALNRNEAAYDQILKVWKKREDAARSVLATYTEVRAKEELIFAARMASRLGQYAAAEEYINICLAMDVSGAEELNAFAEKAKILSAQNKYEDLTSFLPVYIKKYADIPSLYALLGHACQNLKNYEAAAAAWNKALNLDKGNGLYAAGAASALELLGKKSEALRCYLLAAQGFMQQKEYTEMEALVPKLLALGKKSRDAHTLVGQWAADTGNADLAKTELALANKLKRSARAKVKKPDGAAQKPAAKTKRPAVSIPKKARTSAAKKTPSKAGKK